MMSNADEMAMRRRGERYGFTVSKSRARLPLAVDYGLWTVTYGDRAVLTTTDPYDIVDFLADDDAVIGARS